MHSIPKSEGIIRPDISVSIYASLKEHEHVLGSASALFIGGFSIVEVGKVCHTNMEKLDHDIFVTLTLYENTHVREDPAYSQGVQLHPLKFLNLHPIVPYF